MLGMPWGCGDCRAKVGHASVVELLQVRLVLDAINLRGNLREKSFVSSLKFPLHFTKYSLQKLEDKVDTAKSCVEITRLLKVFGHKVVHPNHYVMFRLWDNLYFTSHKVCKASQELL